VQKGSFRGRPTCSSLGSLVADFVPRSRAERAHSTTNFATRLGAAYELFRTRRREMVLRGGIGLYYDLGIGDVTDAASSFPHIRGTQNFEVPYPLSAANAAPPPPPSLEPPYTGSFNVFLPNHPLPRSYQWNITTVDQNLGANQVLSTSYVGQMGHKLLRQTVFPQLNPLFFNEVFWTTNSGSSSYQALQLQFRRRFSRGLAALLTYTWSHSIDETPAMSALTTFMIHSSTAGLRCAPCLQGGIHVQHSGPILESHCPQRPE
jgi:hypothetical protein